MSQLCGQGLTQTCFLGNLCSLICMTLIQLTNQQSALCSGIINTLCQIQHKDNIICGALCQNVAGL